VGEGDGPAHQPGRVGPHFTRGETRLTWLPEGGGQVDLSTVILSAVYADRLAESAIQRISETFAEAALAESHMGPTRWDGPDADPIADIRAMAELYRQHNQAPVTHIRADARTVEQYASPRIVGLVRQLREVAGVHEDPRPGDIVVFDWASAEPVEYVAIADAGFLDGITTPPEEEYVDQLAHDLQPDGCWATELVPVWIDDPPGPGLAPNPSPDAEACDRPAVDELGLCAEHRRRMVDESA
jgi:hypothetical protein